MYERGRGVPRDDAQAVSWFRKAADAGIPVAMNNLGDMYENGRGVPRDDAQAVSWFRKAANAGFPPAMNSLGSMYENGRGVPRDDAQAVSWYRKGHASLKHRWIFTSLRYPFEHPYWLWFRLWPKSAGAEHLIRDL
jgi:TPR repeat protein